jgi:hypothetical protein
MRVKIFEGETAIGCALLTALDPPMRVATGAFEPTAAYDPTQHANVIDGDYIAEHTQKLRIELADGAAIKSDAISIQDFPTLDEIELQILGITSPNFDELFANHPSYKGYWGSDPCE